MREEIEKKDGDATRVKDVFQHLHVFEIQQLSSANDPNLAPDNLSDFKSEKKWREFLGQVE